jgi:hypothetical protein
VADNVVIISIVELIIALKLASRKVTVLTSIYNQSENSLCKIVYAFNRLRAVLEMVIETGQANANLTNQDNKFRSAVLGKKG